MNFGRLSPAAEEAWRSNPNAQRFDALVALRDRLEAGYTMPTFQRPAHRPGVWASDDGRWFADDGDHLGDQFVDVIKGTEVIYRRVDADRWSYLRRTLTDTSAIRAALVSVFGAEAIDRSEAAAQVAA
jgi:hypothetical protein